MDKLTVKLFCHNFNCDLALKLSLNLRSICILVLYIIGSQITLVCSSLLAYRKFYTPPPPQAYKN
jgi:hypothetical protein